jgi:hypothetical protein
MTAEPPMNPPLILDFDGRMERKAVRDAPLPAVEVAIPPTT